MNKNDKRTPKAPVKRLSLNREVVRILQVRSSPFKVPSNVMRGPGVER
jgi:hypothetical protein